MTLLIAVVGSKRSGKTTTIEYLIRQLAKEGLKIGVVKHVHDPNFSIDTPQKDTFRFSQSGAKIVVSSAKKEVAIIKKFNEHCESFHLKEILDFLEKEKLDLIFLEGFHSVIAQRSDVYKIITAKNQEDLEKRLHGTVPPILAVTGLIACQNIKTQVSEIPLINVLTEGNLLLKLIKLALSKKRKY